jgi:hypothetical protein
LFAINNVKTEDHEHLTKLPKYKTLEGLIPKWELIMCKNTPEDPNTITNSQIKIWYRMAEKAKKALNKFKSCSRNAK